MSNLINRVDTETVGIASDATGSTVPKKSDLFIAGFPSVRSCSSDPPQPVTGDPTNRFQVIAANFDSWRTRIYARFNRYRSTIAGLVTLSRPTSHACDVSASADSSIIVRLESLSGRLSRLELYAANNHDDLLLIRGTVDEVRASSDSLLSLQLNQSQILHIISQLISSSKIPTVVAEVTDSKRSTPEGASEERNKVTKRLVKAGSAGVSLSGSAIDRSKSSIDHVVSGNPKWIIPGSDYQFPCPFLSHDHEIADCPEFLAILPKDRWFKIPRDVSAILA